MFRVGRPSDAAVQRFLRDHRDLPFSYEAVGATATRTPPGYTADHNRVVLGSGSDCFARAVEAVRTWRMFDVPGVHLCWPDAPLEVGTTVAIVAGGGPFWSMNACRIVYTVDDDGAQRRFGFAYGTLAAHAVRGEERFLVEWDLERDEIVYDLLAFSVPATPFLQLARPLLRSVQTRFAAHSKAAMLRAAR